VQTGECDLCAPKNASQLAREQQMRNAPRTLLYLALPASYPSLFLSLRYIRSAPISSQLPIPSVHPSNPSIHVHPSLWRANEIERVYLFIWHLSANLAYGQSDPDMGNDSGGFKLKVSITNFKKGLTISLIKIITMFV